MKSKEEPSNIEVYFSVDHSNIASKLEQIGTLDKYWKYKTFFLVITKGCVILELCNSDDYIKFKMFQTCNVSLSTVATHSSKRVRAPHFGWNLANLRFNRVHLIRLNRMQSNLAQIFVPIWPICTKSYRRETSAMYLMSEKFNFQKKNENFEIFILQNLRRRSVAGLSAPPAGPTPAASTGAAVQARITNLSTGLLNSTFWVWCVIHCSD